LGNIWVELLDIVETFSDSVDDRIDIFAVLEFEGQSFSKELLDYRRRQRQTDYRPERAEEIRASCDYSLIFDGCIGN
jgi:hypothetical protein